MIDVKLSKEDVELCISEAKARYYSNRAANNTTAVMHYTKTPYRSDFIGMTGELACAKAYGVDLKKHVFTYNQSKFNKIKNSICDILGYEIKTTDYFNGRLVLKHKDIRKAEPFIACRLVMNSDGTATVTLKGWAYSKEVILPEHEETHHEPAYFMPNAKLRPMDTLPKLEGLVNEQR